MLAEITILIAALEPCIKIKVGTLQTRSISYNFLVADYQYSTATLNYKDTSVKCALSYSLAALKRIPCLHSAFDSNSASLQHRPISLKRLCAVFLALIYTTQIQIHNSTMAISCPASCCLCYHLTSTWLQLSPISRYCVHAIASKLHFTLHAVPANCFIVVCWFFLELCAESQYMKTLCSTS